MDAEAEDPDRELVVDVEPANIATMPSSIASLDTLLVNGTVYTLTSTTDTGHGELLDKIVLRDDVKTENGSVSSTATAQASCTCVPTAMPNLLDAHSNIELDTARGMVCMKVGDTLYQMPLCGIPPATMDISTSQLLTPQDSTVNQGGNFLELSIADPDAEPDTGQTLPTGQNLPDFTKLSATEEEAGVTKPVIRVRQERSTGMTGGKRKGGWPKGKRRKPEIGDKNAPKAPTTGYVLYAMERRKKLEKENPRLFFPEITKLLGNEWSSMPADKKQKYLDEAEADKKRYVEELKAYQESEAYQNFIKKKKLNVNNSVTGSSSDPILDLDDDEGLCCKVCDKYFNNLHNKKEHMLGKMHLQSVKGEYEREQYNAKKMQRNNLLESTSQASPVENGSTSVEEKQENISVDVDSFIQEFMEKNLEREDEIRALKTSLEAAKEMNTQYGKQITEMKDLDTKLEQDLATMKAYGTSLNAQIDMLKMVPTLFGVINF